LLLTGCGSGFLSGASSMRVEVEVYKGPLSKSLPVQVGELISAAREARENLILWRRGAHEVRRNLLCSEDKDRFVTEQKWVVRAEDGLGQATADHSAKEATADAAPGKTKNAEQELEAARANLEHRETMLVGVKGARNYAETRADAAAKALASASAPMRLGTKPRVRWASSRTGRGLGERSRGCGWKRCS